MTVEFRAQQGMYANILKAHVGHWSPLHGGIDLFSYNTPLEGSPIYPGQLRPSHPSRSSGGMGETADPRRRFAPRWWPPANHTDDAPSFSVLPQCPFEEAIKVGVG